jgi:uncharacterized protein (TIGR02118 family)
VKRKEGLTHDEFLAYWHGSHGPLIRDTPGLADHLLRYEQHPVHANDRSGYDGVAVQEFESWDEFVSMLQGEPGDAMRADEANFLSSKDIHVVFTTEPTVMVERPASTAPHPT